MEGLTESHALSFQAGAGLEHDVGSRVITLFVPIMSTRFPIHWKPVDDLHGIGSITSDVGRVPNICPESATNSSRAPWEELRAGPRRGHTVDFETSDFEFRFRHGV